MNLQGRCYRSRKALFNKRDCGFRCSGIVSNVRVTSQKKETCLIRGVLVLGLVIMKLQFVSHPLRHFDGMGSC
jgi:hypothetical protein